MRAAALATTLAVLALGTGCGVTGSNNDSARSASGDANATTPGAGVSPTDSATGSDGNPTLSPEVELETSFRAPVVTGKYVWTANPASGRVAVIDSETFEVRVVDAGFGPTHVAAVDQGDGRLQALVINVNAHDATLLRLEGATISPSPAIRLHQGANAWSVAPQGRFAVAWTDSRQVPNLDPTDGFQDITVLEVPVQGTPEPTRLTVGYRPSAIHFNAAGDVAYVITQDGISVVDLVSTDVRLRSLVTLPSGPGGTQPDVTVNQEGSLALARIEGSPRLFQVQLPSGTTTSLELEGALTDLDVSADGNVAVAVIRQRLVSVTPAVATTDAGTPLPPDASMGDAAVADDAGLEVPAPAVEPPQFVAASEAVFIALPEGLTDATGRRSLLLQDTVVGSVALSNDGSRAVLFSTASSSGQITLVGPALERRTLDLRAPVRAVFVTADGTHAIALQSPAAGSIKPGAFSVIPLAEVRAPSRNGTDAPTEAVALLPGASDRALVTVSDPNLGIFGSYLVRMPSLQIDLIPLNSRPLATGVLPSVGKGFVAQAHPEGRITFIELGDGAPREITGFELSAEVIDE